MTTTKYQFPYGKGKMYRGKIFTVNDLLYQFPYGKGKNSIL